MKLEIIIALISLVSSALTAAFAVVQSQKTQKATSDANLALQKLQADTERRKKAFEIMQKETEPIESAIDTCWQEAQKVKNLVSQLLDPDGKRLDSAIAAMEQLSKGATLHYDTVGPRIPTEVKDAMHSVKVEAVTLLSVLRLKADTYRRSKDLPVEILDQLRKVHLCLTDRQSVFEQSRRELRRNYMQRLLEIL